MATTRQENESMSELTIDTLDKDGALREAVDALAAGTRREFLRKSVGGATVLGALALPATATARSKDQDVAILNYALTLEYLQADFYTETQRLRAVTGQLARIARQLGSVERAHVKAIRKVLGKQAVKKPAFNFRGVTEDPDKFLKTAVAFEDLAVEAYKGQAPRVKSPALLAAAVAIHSVEARHAAWMRYLVGVQPAASAFDDAKAIGDVRRIVASTNFVVARPRKTGRARPRFTG
jgi:rubrerythrin